jgi:hypothetical protein
MGLVQAIKNFSATLPTGKFSPSVMIFGVIGADYKRKLLFIEGTVDARKYIENLEALGFIQELDEQHGALKWIFQQDGAPYHTAKKLLTGLRKITI